MATNINTVKHHTNDSSRLNMKYQELYNSSQAMRIRTEAELQYTQRRLNTMSRLYEQTCKEIFTLRQQLNDAHQALAKLRTQPQ